MATTGDRTGVLATPQRVRDRVGCEPEDLPDTLLEGFIADQQAFVEATLRRTFASGDSAFALARIVITDLAAAMALIRLTSILSESAEYRIGKLDVSKRVQLETWLRLIEELRLHADEVLRVLRRDGRSRGGVAIRARD